MSVPLVITFVGPDRAGLVSAVSDAVAAHRGTWLESRLARLAGQFAGVVRADVPEAQASALQATLAALPGLKLTVTPGGVVEEPPRRRLRLELLGVDRPGIVRDAAGALSRLGVNIAEFESNLAPAPFSGATMFHAKALLEAPESVSPEDIRSALEALAGELTADLLGHAGGLTLAAD